MTHLRLLSWLWTATLLLLAAPVWACPYCVSEDTGIGSVLAIAGMVSVPFVVTGVCFLLIKRANKESEARSPDMSEVC